MAETWEQKLEKKIAQADIPAGTYTVSFSKTDPGPQPTPIGDYRPEKGPPPAGRSPQ